LHVDGEVHQCAACELAFGLGHVHPGWEVPQLQLLLAYDGAQPKPSLGLIIGHGHNPVLQRAQVLHSMDCHYPQVETFSGYALCNKVLNVTEEVVGY
jgi:hypothetical protein